MEISGRDRLDCVRHRLRRASCRACADACPNDCLHLGPGLSLESGACTDCGLCAASCPVQALAGATRELPEAFERLAVVKRAVLGCRCFPEGLSTVRVACLGGLTTLDLVVLATSVRARPLRINLAFCRLCPTGAEVVPAVGRRVDEAADVLGEGRIAILADTREAEMTLQQAMRRGFFRSILAPVASAAHDLSANQRSSDASVPALTDIPDRQRHVLTQLGDLPGSSTTWALAKTPYCDDCCHCAGVCPTGALTRRYREGQRVFGIASERCTGCRACLDFCLKNGLELSVQDGDRPRGRKDRRPGDADADSRSM